MNDIRIKILNGLQNHESKPLYKIKKKNCTFENFIC